MVRIEGSVVIARPVHDVFDFVADERNEPRYNPRMVRAVKVTPGPVGTGTRWAATIESRGRPRDLEIEVTEYRRPERLTTHTRMATADIRGAVTFEPLAGDTRMRWHWELRPKGMLRLLSPLVRRMGARQEQQIWTGLKHCLEASNAPR